jgi:hypothetical protein
MAEVRISKENFKRYEIIVFRKKRGRKNISTKFKEFRQALKLSLDDIVKNFQLYDIEGGEGKIVFYIPEDKEDLADEIFAKLQRKYFRRR